VKALAPPDTKTEEANDCLDVGFLGETGALISTWRDVPVGGCRQCADASADQLRDLARGNGPSLPPSAPLLKPNQRSSFAIGSPQEWQFGIIGEKSTVNHVHRYGLEGAK